jgi:hypothetical protein
MYTVINPSQGDGVLLIDLFIHYDLIFVLNVCHRRS